MHIEMWLTITDEKGRIEKHEKANSPMLALIDMMYVQMAQAAQTIKCTDNTDRSITAAAGNFKATGASGDVTLGIILGTGAGPVAISDNRIGTLVGHGSGSTQASYGTTTLGQPQTSGTSRQFTVSRSITGNPTAAINVTEVALYGYIPFTGQSVCLDHSMNSYTLPIGSTKTWTYTIKVTV